MSSNFDNKSYCIALDDMTIEVVSYGKNEAQHETKHGLNVIKSNRAFKVIVWKSKYIKKIIKMPNSMVEPSPMSKKNEAWHVILWSLYHISVINRGGFVTLQQEKHLAQRTPEIAKVKYQKDSPFCYHF